MARMRNWCSVIQTCKQCNGRFRCVFLAKALVSLGCSGMKRQSWTSEFCKVPNSVGFSVELESFYIYYHQYVFVIITLSKNHGVGFMLGVETPFCFDTWLLPCLLKSLLLSTCLTVSLKWYPCDESNFVYAVLGRVSKNGWELENLREFYQQYRITPIKRTHSRKVSEKQWVLWKGDVYSFVQWKWRWMCWIQNEES